MRECDSSCPRVQLRSLPSLVRASDSAPELSLNAPVGHDQDSSERGEFIPAETRSAEDTVASGEVRRIFLEKVGEFTQDLNERDRQILEERLLAEEPRTLQELGKEFGVSRERVRQLESRLVKRLSEYMKQELVDFEFYAPSRD